MRTRSAFFAYISRILRRRLLTRGAPSVAIGVALLAPATFNPVKAGPADPERATLAPDLTSPEQTPCSGLASAHSAIPIAVRNAEPVSERLDWRLGSLDGGCGCVCGMHVEASDAAEGSPIAFDELEQILNRHLTSRAELANANETPVARLNGSGPGLNIELHLSPIIASDPAFIAGLDLAAAYWTSIVKDPITVNINVDYLPHDFPSVMAVALPSVDYEYEILRQAMSAKVKGREVQSVIDLLPEDVVTFVTSGSDPNDPEKPLVLSSDDFGSIQVTRPTARMLGLPLPEDVDASILFNPTIFFDPDPNDGVIPGAVDLVFVMTHAIGHVLGFRSSVGVTSTPLNQPPPLDRPPTTLDLFRFGVGSAFNNPDTPDSFSTLPREFRPGVEAALDTAGVVPGVGAPFRFSTGISHGDGRDASHWKDQNLLGLTESIGVMTPNLGLPGNHTMGILRTSDLYALALLGWSIDFRMGIEPNPGDLNGDGAVNAQDLAILLSHWGDCPDPEGACPADLNQDGVVNAQDLAILLSHWDPAGS